MDTETLQNLGLCIFYIYAAASVVALYLAIRNARKG